MNSHPLTTRLIRRLLGANAALVWEALRQRSRQRRQDDDR